MERNESFDIYAYMEERFRFQLSPEDAELLMQGSKTLTLKKGEVLYNSGDPNHTVYYLRQGTVKYHMIYPDGSSRSTAYGKAPGFLGVINILPHHTAANYCTAATACTISTCPIELFLERAKANNMMDKLFFMAVGASRHIYSTLTALLSEERANLVDVLRNQEMLTLQETADFVGCTREHVSRICKQLDQNK